MVGSITGSGILNILKNVVSRISGKRNDEVASDELYNSYQEACNIHFPESNNIPASDLFHYTDFNGLKGIISSKQLWMTHYQYLNDPSEVRYALHTIIEIIKKNIKASSNAQFWENFLAFFSNGISGTDIFVLSFCQNGNYLPAWRWYADDGAGFSIGFKKKYKYFEPYILRKKSPSEPICKFEEISYVQPNTMSHLTECIEKLIQLTEQYLSSNQEENTRQIHDYLAVTLLPLLTKIKHNAYKEECESRIYIIGSKTDTDRPIERFYKTSDTSSEQFVRSVLFTKHNFNVNDISSIGVGPRCNFKHAEIEIRKLLVENGYDKNIEIRASCIPYRNNV